MLLMFVKYELVTVENQNLSLKFYDFNDNYFVLFRVPCAVLKRILISLALISGIYSSSFAFLFAGEYFTQEHFLSYLISFYFSWISHGFPKDTRDSIITLILSSYLKAYSAKTFRRVLSTSLAFFSESDDYQK